MKPFNSLNPAASPEINRRNSFMNTKPTKVVIELQSGYVQAVYSNTPIQYVIVDYDDHEMGDYPLSVPLETDGVAKQLYTLYNESDPSQSEIRELLRRIEY